MAGLEKGANPDHKYDWAGPWRNLLKLLNVLLVHFVGFSIIAGIARLLEFYLTLVSENWTIGGISVSLVQIAHYGDLFIVVVFLGVALFDVIKWAIRQ
jgi:hypothetical protein